MWRTVAMVTARAPRIPMSRVERTRTRTRVEPHRHGVDGERDAGVYHLYHDCPSVAAALVLIVHATSTDTFHRIMRSCERSCIKIMSSVRRGSVSSPV